jgi:transcriptional regulator with XRE-family HTH domain
MISTFADRLWWARHKMGLGATRLARLVGCSQSLISSLERANADKSKLTNKFADALNVDPTWLAFGIEEKAPPKFDPEYARKGRENMSRGGGGLVRLPTTSDDTPLWASDSTPEPLSPLTDVDALENLLVSKFHSYARIAGPERTALFLTTLDHVAKLVAFNGTGGEDQQQEDERS